MYGTLRAYKKKASMMNELAPPDVNVCALRWAGWQGQAATVLCSNLQQHKNRTKAILQRGLLSQREVD